MPPTELKSGARKMMRDNSPKLFFISIIFVGIVTIMSELQFRLLDVTNAYDQLLQHYAAGELPGFGAYFTYLRPSGVPFAVLLWVFSSLLDAGYKSYCLKISRGRPGEYKDIFDGFLFVGKVLLIRIITALLTALWSILLIFPGIVASYRYRQARYILFDNPQKGALQCIRESKQLMSGKKLDLFLVDLSFAGWLALDYLVLLILPLPFSLPIIEIWLTPYHGLTCAAFYNRLINSLTV